MTYVGNVVRAVISGKPARRRSSDNRYDNRYFRGVARTKDQKRTPRK